MKLISLCIYLFLQREPKQTTEKKQQQQPKQIRLCEKKDAELSEKEQNNGLQQIVVYS